jgi:hypothetical protein
MLMTPVVAHVEYLAYVPMVQLYSPADVLGAYMTYGAFSAHVAYTPLSEVEQFEWYFFSSRPHLTSPPNQLPSTTNTSSAEISIARAALTRNAKATRHLAMSILACSSSR